MTDKLIIFDLDGTLTDSGPGIKNCIAYALEKLGKPIPDDKTLESFIGPPLSKQFPVVAGLDEEGTKEAIRYFRERYNTIGVFENSVYPGIEEMLKGLKNSGCRLALASSKPHIMAEKVLDHFELMKYFDCFQGAVSDHGREDKVDIISAALEKAGYLDKREHVWMVGDRKYDAMGAKGCGIGFYGVRWGYAPKGELEAFGNVQIADSPEDLYKMIVKVD